MKPFLAVLLTAALAGFAGCDSSSTPGGPGAVNPPAAGSGTVANPAASGPETVNRTAARPVIGETENTFTLDVPMLATTIKQGEAKNISISIKRGKNFDQDVTLQVTEMPTGVTIEPASPVIRRGDKEAKLTLKAADEAALGDFTVSVTGQPGEGAVASSQMKVRVEKK